MLCYRTALIPQQGGSPSGVTRKPSPASAIWRYSSSCDAGAAGSRWQRSRGLCSLPGVQERRVVTQVALPSESFTMRFGERTMDTRWAHDGHTISQITSHVGVVETGYREGIRGEIRYPEAGAIGEKSTSLALAQCRCGLGLGRSKVWGTMQ
jgi:hypothetical protein